MDSRTAANGVYKKKLRDACLLVVVCFASWRVLYALQPSLIPGIDSWEQPDHLNVFHARTSRSQHDAITYPNVSSPLSNPKRSASNQPHKIYEATQAKSYLHLVVPATSTNENLCKMLLSITALGYPAPVFVNWGDVEKADPYVQHLAKVGGILRYLNTLPKSRENDLLLIVDGFDAWFQLSPDVLISRYYDVIEAENKRLVDRFGWERIRKHKLFQSVIFGPDKICWPEDDRRPACWAVPDSTLPKYAFGPGTDRKKFRELNRPRWLNSGTIMGPLQDVRNFMEAALERIQSSHDDVVSDQYHMANMFGEQEYARTLLLNKDIARNVTTWKTDDWVGASHEVKTELTLPDLKPDRNYEYHLTIDYESRLFQTAAYYWKYLGWYAYDETTTAGDLGVSPEGQQRLLDNSLSDQTHFTLAQDILASPPPLSGITNDRPSHVHGYDPSKDPQVTSLEIPAQLSWSELILGTNIVTGNVFPLVHFTPPKDYIESWWSSMWFFPYGEAILRNAPSAAMRERPYYVSKDGRPWWPWVTDDMDDVAPEHRVGGGFDDRGAWHSWHRLCEKWEEVVFLNHRRTRIRE